jgi:hypothetical protein
MNQSYQVAYWKQRFGVSEDELAEAGILAFPYPALRVVPKARNDPTLPGRLSDEDCTCEWFGPTCRRPFRRQPWSSRTL